MSPHNHWHDPVLINTIGHTAGVLLFGLIIALLLRDCRTRGLRHTTLSLVAALLALGWNVGSLVAVASPEPASQAVEIIMTASFAMLSLLPAVLVQVAVQGKHRFVVATGYVVSACAACLHFSESFSSSSGLHHAALLVIVVGFGVLAFVIFFLDRQCESVRSEWISLACLLLFTTSFLHFGYQHTSSAWTAEIAWHHIGIPVALIVLLRDYRFLLLDTFTRFLVNSGVAAAYLAAVLVINQKFRLSDLIFPSMFLTGIALVLLCLSLILFAHLRNALQAWVNRVIFRRQSVEGCVGAIARATSSAGSEEELLGVAARLLAEHLRTEQFAISAEQRLSEMPLIPSHEFRAEAQLPLRFSSGDARWLIFGSRRGGRRYGSDDLRDLQRLGVAIVEQVERFRGEELKRLAGEAELRALQAQINPHFLFNALNTLYGTIDRRSLQARRTVLNLAEIFRYFLQGNRTVISLSEELRIVEAYLEIEGLRFGDRLKTELNISDSARHTMIPILSIQPLVENAVKHGIGLKEGAGLVCVRAQEIAEGLRVSVEDTGVGFERSRRSEGGTGVGLENVRRRLALSYGSKADLQIESSAAGTIVSFLIPGSPRAGQFATQPFDTQKPLVAVDSPLVMQTPPAHR